MAIFVVRPTESPTTHQISLALPLLLTLLFCLLCHSKPSPGQPALVFPDWFKQSFLDLSEDVQEAAGTDRRVILLFHQDSCPYCQALVRHTLSNPGIAAQTQVHFAVIAIDIWGDRELITPTGETLTEKQFAAQLRVRATPTLIFLDLAGRQVLRLNSHLPPRRLRLALEYVSQGDYDAQSYQAFAARFAAARPHQNGQDRDTAATNDPTPPGYAYLALFYRRAICPTCAADARTSTKPRCEPLDLDANTPIRLPDGTLKTTRELVRDLDIRFRPTVLLLDREGREILRHEGKANKTRLGNDMNIPAPSAAKEGFQARDWLRSCIE